MNPRILVVGGGGCRGAWGAGYLQMLTTTHGVYDIGFGTSTGSLMLPLVLLNEFPRLKHAYTTVKQEKVFNKNPFKKNGELRFGVIWRLITGKKTLGESHNLRKLIDEFLYDSDLQTLNEKGKMFGVAVVSFKTADKYLIKSNERGMTPCQIKDWIYASSNQPLFMSFYPDRKFDYKDKGFFVDGGVRETVPIKYALEYAYENSHVRHIDVIINQPKKVFSNDCDFKPKDVLKSLLRLTQIWRDEVIGNDILLALHEAGATLTDEEKIEICLHYFPHEYFATTQNDLIFDPEIMEELWKAGEEGKEDKGVKLLTHLNKYVISRSRLKQYFDDEKSYYAKVASLRLQKPN